MNLNNNPCGQNICCAITFVKVNNNRLGYVADLGNAHVRECVLDGVPVQAGSVAMICETLLGPLRKLMAWSVQHQYLGPVGRIARPVTVAKK